MKFIKIFIVIFIISVFAVQAQNVSFTASIDRNPVGKGERFQVVFSLNNASGTGFKEPSFRGFRKLQGPFTSHSTNIVNGRSSSSVKYTYVLQADQEGEFVISPAQISANGQRMKTNTIEVKVIADPTDARQQQQREREKSMSAQAKQIMKDNIFVRQSVSKKQVYVGEPITVSYKIFVNPELRPKELHPDKIPTFDGFWVNEIELPEEQWKTEIINGRYFQSKTVSKYILYPQKSGNLTIKPLVFKSTVAFQVPDNSRRNRRSMFDDFFRRGNYKDFTYYPTSGASKINVKPLPTPIPDDYIGAVGDIKLKAWMDNPNTRVNEPVTLKIEVSGSGNLKLIDPMELKLPKDIETYEPKINDNMRISAGGYTGKRTFEYLLIPRHSGKYKLYPMGFSYFDLKQKKFVKLMTPEMEINVEKGEGGETGVSVSGVSKEDVEFIGKDIRFIESAPSSFEKEEELFFGSAVFYSLIALPGLAFVVFFVYRRKQEELHANTSLLKNKKANKVARQRLSLANQMLTKGDSDKFYEALTQALWGYLGDKLAIDPAALTKDKAIDSLQKKGIEDHVIQDYMSILDKAEFARYAPSKSEQAVSEDYNHASDLISILEGGLK
jgi:hypothetical protein